YIEPCHREDDSVRLIEQVLSVEPTNLRACVLLGYCSLHYLIAAAAIDRAQTILLRLTTTSDRQWSAARLIVLDEIESILNPDADARSMELLRRCIDLEPDWVWNHQRLARRLAGSGQRGEAINHMTRAVSNLERFAGTRVSLVEE